MLGSIFRPMDFEGQRLAETLLVRLVLATAALSFVVGWAWSSFQLMALINGVGLALVALLVLPPWPQYSKTPMAWLPPLKPQQE